MNLGFTKAARLTLRSNLTNHILHKQPTSMDPPSNPFELAFGILGILTGVGVNLATMATFWHIYKIKSTEGFSGLPYVLSLVAALLWVLYGLPIVTKGALFILTANVAVSAIQIFYLTVFLIYAPKRPRRYLIKVMAACFVFLGILAGIIVINVPRYQQRHITVGSFCVATGVLAYAFPLSVLRMVVRTHSVEFVPIVPSVFLFINGAVWTCYGVIVFDIFVLIPNVLGVLFGLVVLSVYATYRNGIPEAGKNGDASVRPVATNTFDDEESMRGVRTLHHPSVVSQGANNENLQPPPHKVSVVIDQSGSI